MARGMVNPRSPNASGLFGILPRERLDLGKLTVDRPRVVVKLEKLVPRPSRQNICRPNEPTRKLASLHRADNRPKPRQIISAHALQQNGQIYIAAFARLPSRPAALQPHEIEAFAELIPQLVSSLPCPGSCVHVNTLFPYKNILLVYVEPYIGKALQLDAGASAATSFATLEHGNVDNQPTSNKHDSMRSLPRNDSSHLSGMARYPYIAPASAPATHAVVSESSPKSTAASTHSA